MEGAHAPESIVVVSPHQDDAALSLGAAIECWGRCGISVLVLNVFTRSMFAPRLPPPLPDVVALRAREDREALSLLHPFVRIRNLNHLDAPLRLGITPERVCEVQPICPADKALVEDLRWQIPDAARVFFPLAIGHHIDHRLTFAASTLHGNVAFYEDLPYALRYSKGGLVQQVHQAEAFLGRSLDATTLGGDLRGKALALAHYRSQLSGADILEVCYYGARLQGERIWLAA